MAETARVTILAKRPGQTIAADDFQIVERDLRDPGEGEVRVRNTFVSVDPYMRLALSDRPGFPASKPVGEAMDGAAVGVVERSNAPGVSEGALVTSRYGWRDRFVARAGEVQQVPAQGIDPSWYLGILGMTGMTAYVGIELILDPQPGETVFVSGAAGAVGSVAAQLAKLRGCTVIGTAGTAEKVAWLRDDLGLDAVANYRDTDLRAFLAETCPGGLNCYFDNVGGDTLDAALLAMAPRGRVLICGAIANYNTENHNAGPAQFFKISEKGLTFTGLNVGMWYDRASEIVPALAKLLGEGKLKVEQTVVDGLDQAPAAFLSLFEGANTGKLVVRI